MLMLPIDAPRESYSVMIGADGMGQPEEQDTRASQRNIVSFHKNTRHLRFENDTQDVLSRGSEHKHSDA